jgi:hypothetical protein
MNLFGPPGIDPLQRATQPQSSRRIPLMCVIVLKRTSMPAAQHCAEII